MDPKKRHPNKTILAFALVGLCAVAGASQLKITNAPLYSGDRSPGTKPIAVTIQNTGAEAVGVLHVVSSGSSTDYPVDIPANSAKKVIVYAASGYGHVNEGISLSTNMGSASCDLTNTGLDYSTPKILVITDNPGTFSWLESANRSNTTGLDDIYCQPEDAQPRIVAYDTAAAVILGAGAERISDGAVQALKAYAMEGGMLVFLGGASNASLADPRWQDALPATDFRQTSVDHSDELERLGAERLNGPITLWEPQNTRGATLREDHNHVLTAEAGYGFGRVLCTTFDPTDAKIEAWDGRWNAVYSILRPALANPRLVAVNSFGGDPQQVINQKAETPNDPFNAKLPPLGQVLGILIAYFVTVLPVNFLVLRKIRRAELAWFTAPVLSLGFASILFHSAKGLYGDGFSTATKGVVVTRSGSADGVFVGDTAMFLPTGGHYNLKMNGVDSIGDIEESDVFRPGQDFASSYSEVLAIDDGQLNIPNLSVGNLAFRQINYTQKVGLGNVYDVSLRQQGANAICEVRNDSDKPLTNARVVLRNHVSASQDVAPHSTASFKVDLSRSPNPPETRTVDGYDQINPALRDSGNAALIATMDGFRPGPQVGEQIDARTNVTLLVFSKDSLGGLK